MKSQVFSISFLFYNKIRIQSSLLAHKQNAITFKGFNNVKCFTK